MDPKPRSDDLGNPRVALFVTCLVDAMRPQVGFASMALLDSAGCRVEVPVAQTCCGQPALNSGDRSGARRLAQATIALLEPYEFVVAPSGSCAATIRLHYPELFIEEDPWLARATALAARTHELMSFLVDVRGWSPRGVALDASATYHDSCSGLRELNVQSQPRRLLAAVDRLALRPLQDSTTCCGFGGTFCVKYAAISNAIVGEKVRNIQAAGADLLLGGDLGCLMNMAGKLHRGGSKVRVFHAAELLAGMGTGPAIGEVP
jgi:L-lactate dehydrogenase complex protein LldE